MLVGNLISSSSKFLARSSQFTLPQASQPFFTHVETGYSLQFLRARQRPWFYFDSTADGLWVRFSTSHWLNMDDYWLEVREKDQSKKGAASKLKKIRHEYRRYTLERFHECKLWQHFNFRAPPEREDKHHFYSGCIDNS